MLAVANTAWAALLVCGGAVIVPVALIGWAASILADKDKEPTRQDGD